MSHVADLCDCTCGHEYGLDLGANCTDDYCGYCGYCGYSDEATVDEVTVDEGRTLFDDATQRLLGVSGEEFIRRLDADDIPLEWPGHKVCRLRILVPFGRPALEQQS